MERTEAFALSNTRALLTHPYPVVRTLSKDAAHGDQRDTPSNQLMRRTLWKAHRDYWLVKRMRDDMAARGETHNGRLA